METFASRSEKYWMVYFKKLRINVIDTDGLCWKTCNFGFNAWTFAEIIFY